MIHLEHLGEGKLLPNHCHAISLHFMHYNLCRVHKTLKATPAMAAGLASRAWNLDEVINLLE